ncbi:MAG: aldo/keto reductase [Candidatus Sericytochromatia bacterium]
MKYNLLGRTGLLVSEICLGTMTYGGKGFWENIGKLPQEAVDEQLKYSFDSGINFIDTANIYSFGESEKLVGQGIKNLGLPREELVIATKVRGRMSPSPNNVGLSRASIMTQVENSLKRLQTDYIDLYQIHGVDPLTPIDETLRALNDLVTSGKVRYLGLSNLAAWQIMKSLGVSDKNGWNRFESIQAFYSIASRDLELEIVPLAEDQNLSILVWSPLAGGLLSGKFSREHNPEGARRSSFDFPIVDKERAFNCVDKMKTIADEHGVSVARIALAWCLHQKKVTSIIIGAKTNEQLQDNISSTEIKLSESQLKELDEVSKLPPQYPDWMLKFQQGDRFSSMTNAEANNK